MTYITAQCAEPPLVHVDAVFGLQAVEMHSRGAVAVGAAVLADSLRDAAGAQLPTTIRAVANLAGFDGGGSGSGLVPYLIRESLFICAIMQPRPYAFN